MSIPCPVALETAIFWTRNLKSPIKDKSLEYQLNSTLEQATNVFTISNAIGPTSWQDIVVQLDFSWMFTLKDSSGLDNIKQLSLTLYGIGAEINNMYAK